jgi:hypothetical protein
LYEAAVAPGKSVEQRGSRYRGKGTVNRLRTRVWKIADSIMLVLFAFSVVVQFNDPDPLRWAGMYGLAAVACALALAGRQRWWFPATVAALALVWAGALAPRVIGEVRFLDMFGAFEMKSVAIEEAREMYGLVLVAAWMVVLSVRAAHRRQRGLSTPA